MFDEAPKTRAFYRIQATRKLMGAGDIVARKFAKRDASGGANDDDALSATAALLPLMPAKPKRVDVGSALSHN